MQKFIGWFLVKFGQNLAHLHIICVSCEYCWLADWGEEFLKRQTVLADQVNFARPEVLPLCWTWQIDITGNSTLFKDWGDQDVFSKHELRVDLSCPFVIWEMEHQRSCESGTVLACFLHQIHLVVGELDVNFNKFLEEKNRVLIIVNLVLCLGDIRWVRPLNRVWEGVHFNPALKHFLASCVVDNSFVLYFLYHGSVSTDIRMTNRSAANTAIHETDQSGL